MRRIGIDVGGTNTDAVLVENDRVVRSVKTPTTQDVTSGIMRALASLHEGGVREPLDAVMIGTTHFTNAVVQRRELSRVAAVRIGLPASASLPPFVDWPRDLAEVVRGEVFQLEGGHEVDGRPIVPFDEKGARGAARRIRELGLRSVGVTSVFSPLAPDCEDRALAILREECEDVDVTLSKDVGRIGILGRENATLLNAAIIELARRTTRAFTEALRRSGIEAPLYLTQNDGTVSRAELAEKFPIYSFASGPTNSMRGAALLSGLSEALVVDVGGTTSDVGCLKAGFPREANNVVEIGGVRTLFRMPDLLSVGLGGGSLVEDGADVRVGPRSVGYQITEEALVFGGDRVTATDIAVAAGLVELGDRARAKGLPAELVRKARAWMAAMIEEAVDRMKTGAAPEPLVAVGGGAFLVPGRIPGISEVVHVVHQGVANAVGAALAQVCGEVDQVFSGIGRADAIDRAMALARERAVEAGADEETLEVVDVEDLPLAYLPGEARRVRARVVGDVFKG
ncbi:MAG TPA: hydantoinase/oxoprolinase family protein [Vicinamibacteria bacterium]|nr:hydantoinase/oxoprolinase family protein [Vicinamibacteria bacterium]